MISAKLYTNFHTIVKCSNELERKLPPPLKSVAALLCEK